MEEKQDADVDDVDRESLVKEIELIRQTLGDASTRARSDCIFVGFDDQGTEKESDDSDDELAIIRSPEYSERTTDTYRAQHVPVEIISSESECECEILEIGKKKRTLPTRVSGDSDSPPEECVNQSQDNVVLLNNSAQHEQFSTSPSTTIHAITENTGNTDNEAPLSPEERASDYTLTELQPIQNSNQFLQHTFESSFDRNASAEPAEVTTEDWVPEEEILLSAEEDDEELSEQQRCLKLNRKYQAIIEAQLKKIEKLIIENREQQFGLSQTSSSLFSNAHEIDDTHLGSYANPYFKVTRKENTMNAQDRRSVPDDNEDTKLRKSIGQPHPFEKPPKAWSLQDKKILSDAVKSEILQAKLMPLLQRIDDIGPKETRSKEDEKELADLRKQIDRLKNLTLSVLVEDFYSPIDFQDISNKVLPSRTPHQCQVMWYNELHPHLNKGKWTKEEDKLLLKFAEENDTDGNWERIARELKSNRSPAQCLRRFQKSLNKNFLKSKWGPEDDQKLVQAVKMCGVGPWETVSSFLDGRTGAQCMHRYNKSLDPLIKRGKWEDEEDDLVRKGVEMYGFNWKNFKRILPRRTDSQVRERWQDVLDPRLRKDAWTKEEDEKLLKIVEEQSVGLTNWATIAKHMPGRTDNRCRRRWFILTKNDPKTKKHLRNTKIKRDKLVNNFSRRRADKSDIGPEDIEVSDLSETDENISNMETPNATVNDGDAAEDGTVDKVDAALKDRAAVKDRTALKDRAAVKDRAAREDRAVVKNRAAVKDRAAVKGRAVVKGRAANKDRAVLNDSSAAKDRNAGKGLAAVNGSAAVIDRAAVNDSAAVEDCAAATACTNFDVPETSKSPTSVSANKKVAKKKRKEKSKTSHALEPKQPSPKSTETLNVTSQGKVREKTVRTSRQVKTRNNKDPTSIITTQAPSKTTKSPSKSAKTTLTQLHKKTQKPKLTAPSPTVVSQASSLPNGMPISLLTQFSVLLQAFHVDVSGVLQNVNKPREETIPPSNTITSSVGEQTPLTAITQTVAQRPEPITSSAENVSVAESRVVPHDLDTNVNNQVTNNTEKPAKTPTTTVAHHSTVVVSTALPPLSPPVSATDQAKKSKNNINKDSGSAMEGNDKENDVSNVRTTNMIGKPARKTALKPQEITETPRPLTGEENIGSIRSLQVVISDARDTCHNSVGTIEGNERNNDVSSAATMNKIRTAASNTFSNTEEITETRMPVTEQVNVRSNACIEAVISDASHTSSTTEGNEKNSDVSNGAVGFNLSSDTDNSSKLSDNNADTLKSLSDNVGDKEGNARHTSYKRKRDSKDMDVISGKRLNSEENRGRKGTEEGRNESTAVLLSDRRHGLNHDIVVLQSSPPREGVNSDGRLRTSKRKLDTSGHTIQARGRKRSKKSESESNTHSDASACYIEPDATSPRRYPKRSTRIEPKVNSCTLAGSTAAKINEASVPESVSASNMSQNNSISSGSASSIHIESSPYLNVKRVVINSDKRFPRVPAIPPLPPSATTLSAFRKLLSLRKDLQTQANRLNVTDHVTNESPQNPLADRLLLVSNTNQTLREEYQYSVAYQQLLNRFKGLFLWPGFLSIVNPNFQKPDNNEDPSQTVQTPNTERRHRRQTR